MDAASFRVQDFWTPKPLAECDHYKMVVLLDAVLSLEGRDLLGMGQALNARLNGRCHEVGMLSSYAKTLIAGDEARKPWLPGLAFKLHRPVYLRTSSKTNVGHDKDSDKRQLAAIAAYAKANGFAVVDTYYDAAVSGADPVTDRAGFAEMLERLLSNGARTIIVESPDRFACDLMVQLAGHDTLKAKGIALIAASAPTFFLEDTPTAVLVRQVLGAIAQFEKAGLVAKLAAARKRKRVANGKCEGRKSLADTNPNAVALAKTLSRKRPKGGQMSLRAVSAEMAAQGFLNERGAPFNHKSIASMLAA